MASCHTENLMLKAADADGTLSPSLSLDPPVGDSTSAQSLDQQTTQPSNASPVHENKRIVILYGSQTGNGAELSERLAVDAYRLGFTDIELTALDTYDVRQLPSEELCLIVCSTQGQGDPPLNARKFYRFLLRKDLPPDSLCNVSFALFALGDSSYPIYNACGRRIYQRMLDLGASNLVERGMGDEQDELGYEDGFVPWRQTLWAFVRERCSWITEDLDHSTTFPPLKYQAKFVGSDLSVNETVNQIINPTESSADIRWCQTSSAIDPTLHPSINCVLPPIQLPPFGLDAANRLPFCARLTVNHRITPDNHFQDVRHMEFDLSSIKQSNTAINPSIVFEPGDIVDIFPRNHPKLVREFIEMIGYQPEDVIEIEALTSDVSPIRYEDFLPTRVSLQELFEVHLDLCGVPKRSFFEFLSTCTEHPDHREKLAEYGASNQTLNQAREFARYCTKEGRTYAEVLADFHTARPTLSQLISILPRLQPRSYSISNAQLLTPDRLQITVALVSFLTPFKRARQGVCSTFFSLLPSTRHDDLMAKQSATSAADLSIDPATNPPYPSLEQIIYIPMRITKGSFRFPAALGFNGVPAVMCGPGTGVAPFRAMMQHKLAQIRSAFKQTHNNQSPHNQSIVQSSDQPVTGPGGLPNVDGTPDQADFVELASVYSDFTLVFGNRNQHADFFYEDEWRYHQSINILSHPVIAAFSRDQPDKYYVQDAMQECGNAALIYDLVVRRKGFFFVAGSSGAMPREVRRALTAVIQSEGGLTEEEAREYLRTMEKDRKYIQEVW